MRRTRFALALAAVVSCGLTGCPGGASDPPGARTIDTPAGPGSMAPNLALGLDGELYLSWIEPSPAGHALRFSTWSDDGRWSAPRTVAEGDDWFVNWADVPSMTALADGTLAAHWLARSGGATWAYGVRVAVSPDAGVHWSSPVAPHHDATETEHGFVSLVPGESEFAVLWLDGRNTSGDPPGPMTLRSASLLRSGEVRAEAEVDDRVCDCCATDARRTGDGAIVAVYRDRTASEVRDVSVTRFDGLAWSPPRTVHEDGWRTAACPVNGPALDTDGDRVVVAWFTGAGDEPVVRAAFSTDGGRTFGPPVRVDHGDPLGRVDVVALEDGAAAVSWLERDGDRARILVRRVTASGAAEATPVAATSAGRDGGFPRMARFGNEIFLVWTETGDPSRIAAARLPI